jgi:hypothetical protein
MRIEQSLQFVKVMPGGLQTRCHPAIRFGFPSDLRLVAAYLCNLAPIAHFVGKSTGSIGALGAS